METVKVERIDHLGIVAGVIKDLKIIEMIDSAYQKIDRRKTSVPERLSPEWFSMDWVFPIGRCR